MAQPRTIFIMSRHHSMFVNDSFIDVNFIIANRNFYSRKCSNFFVNMPKFFTHFCHRYSYAMTLFCALRLFVWYFSPQYGLLRHRAYHFITSNYRLSHIFCRIEKKVDFCAKFSTNGINHKQILGRKLVLFNKIIYICQKYVLISGRG